MGRLQELKIKKYSKIKNKYPNVDYVYKAYKMNNFDYHLSHKFVSWRFLRKLVSAEKRHKNLLKIQFPRGTYNPFLKFSVNQQGRFVRDKNCSALPDCELLPRKKPEDLVKELSKYDIISFDVFDTLIFRPLAHPTDLFYLLETKFGVINFKDYRMNAEYFARQKTKKPNFEVDIFDIYEELEKRCLVKTEDANFEIETEKQICYANPYMLEVFNLLKKKKKKIIAISDMYLPSNVIKEILDKNGYKELDDIFVSCEHGHCKGTGKLFEIVKAKYPSDTKFVHIGDNEESDIKGSQKAEIDSYHYEQCNEFGNKFRPYYMLSPVSSMYKGVVNNYLYNGITKMTARESFGFLYGGPIVAGYCEWVNNFARNNNLEKICFIARDMDIFYKAYVKHYKEFDTDYVRTSRFSLQECLYTDFTDELVFHTISSRCNRGYTIEQAFNELNLTFLFEKCEEYNLNPKSFISDANFLKIHDLIVDNKMLIADHFKDNEEAAKKYFKEKLGGARRVCFADLGWRGSIVAYLEHLLVKKWKLCDEVKGVLFGSTQSTAAINLISRGIVTCYAYDHLHNRDLVRQAHNDEFAHVMVMESLFTSEENSLIEYNLDKKNNKVKFVEYEDNPNKEIIHEFHNGMMEYVDQLEKHRKPFRKYLPMSAVDAFEPMNIILQNGEYIARIIGDVLDTPYQVAGLNIPIKKYVPLGEILLEKGIIKQWPFN